MRDVVLDQAVFDQLAEEMGGVVPARRIVTLYLDQLPHRVARLGLACAAGDARQAMDAVLSLKVSSATIGAAAMFVCARTVEGTVVLEDWTAALGAMDGVESAGRSTCAALTWLLDQPEG